MPAMEISFAGTTSGVTSLLCCCSKRFIRPFVFLMVHFMGLWLRIPRTRVFNA